jgi:hypothetical protein
MTTSTNGKDSLVEAKRHSVGYVISAAVLLGMASLSLLASSLWPSVSALFLGQILFVVFVFAAVTLLVMTAIAQDIRKTGRNDGIRTS